MLLGGLLLRVDVEVVDLRLVFGTRDLAEDFHVCLGCSGLLGGGTVGDREGVFVGADDFV